VSYAQDPARMGIVYHGKCMLFAWL